MLWIIDCIENLKPAAVLARIHELSAPRQARVYAMKHEAAQVRSILAELLLRRAVEAECGRTELPRQAFGEKGKPFFPDLPTLCFNLSHCQTAVACALDSAPLGVDVQELRRLRQKPSAHAAPALFRVLSEPERNWVLQTDDEAEQDRRFTALWTCKEAYGKALGQGIVYALEQTAFLPRSEPWRQYGFCFQQLALSSGFATLCAQAPLAVRRISPAELLI